jgi:DNA-binding transcriptional MerR regulator
MRTSQVAKRAGLNIQTLRYYERRGLIPEPARSPGGHRSYPPETIELLRVIKTAQRLGFTLKEVTELLDLSRYHQRPRRDLREHAMAKLAQINAKIDDLITIRDTLEGVMAAECDDLTNCSSPNCPLPAPGAAGDH